MMTYHPGRIVKLDMADGTVGVLFDAGGVEDVFPEHVECDEEKTEIDRQNRASSIEQLTRSPEIKEGVKVKARWNATDEFLPGRVGKINHEYAVMEIEYDNGQFEHWLPVEDVKVDQFMTTFETKGKLRRIRGLQERPELQVGAVVAAKRAGDSSFSAGRIVNVDTKEGTLAILFGDNKLSKAVFPENVEVDDDKTRDEQEAFARMRAELERRPEVREGARVDARWKGGAFHPGKIGKIHHEHGTMEVAFDDGRLEHWEPVEHVKVDEFTTKMEDKGRARRIRGLQERPELREGAIVMAKRSRSVVSLHQAAAPSGCQATAAASSATASVPASKTSGLDGPSLVEPNRVAQLSDRASGNNNLVSGRTASTPSKRPAGVSGEPVDDENKRQRLMCKTCKVPLPAGASHVHRGVPFWKAQCLVCWRWCISCELCGFQAVMLERHYHTRVNGRLNPHIDREHRLEADRPHGAEATQGRRHASAGHSNEEGARRRRHSAGDDAFNTLAAVATNALECMPMGSDADGRAAWASGLDDERSAEDASSEQASASMQQGEDRCTDIGTDEGPGSHLESSGLKDGVEKMEAEDKDGNCVLEERGWGLIPLPQHDADRPFMSPSDFDRDRNSSVEPGIDFEPQPVVDPPRQSPPRSAVSQGSGAGRGARGDASSFGPSPSEVAPPPTPSSASEVRGHGQLSTAFSEPSQTQQQTVAAGLPASESALFETKSVG